MSAYVTGILAIPVVIPKLYSFSFFNCLRFSVEIRESGRDINLTSIALTLSPDARRLTSDVRCPAPNARRAIAKPQQVEHRGHRGLEHGDGIFYFWGRR